MQNICFQIVNLHILQQQVRFNVHINIISNSLFSLVIDFILFMFLSDRGIPERFYILPNCCCCCLHFNILHIFSLHFTEVYSPPIKIISKNHDNIDIQQGKEIVLSCMASTTVLACVFRGPKGQSYSMLKGAK